RESSAPSLLTEGRRGFRFVWSAAACCRCAWTSARRNGTTRRRRRCLPLSQDLLHHRSYDTERSLSRHRPFARREDVVEPPRRTVHALQRRNPQTAEVRDGK